MYTVHGLLFKFNFADLKKLILFAWNGEELSNIVLNHFEY